MYSAELFCTGLRIVLFCDLEESFYRTGFHSTSNQSLRLQDKFVYSECIVYRDHYRGVKVSIVTAISVLYRMEASFLFLFTS